MEDTRITGIRELYNISEIGNQRVFFISSRARRLNERKEICVGSGAKRVRGSYERREKDGRKVYKLYGKGAESNYVTRSTCLKLIGHLRTTPVLYEGVARGWNTS